MTKQLTKLNKKIQVGGFKKQGIQNTRLKATNCIRSCFLTLANYLLKLEKHLTNENHHHRMPSKNHAILIRNSIGGGSV